MNDRKAVLCIDNVDPDNAAAAIAACHGPLGLNLKAVIVTGRPATHNRNAPPGVYDAEYSQEVLQRNTRRIKGLLIRHGRPDIPVFSGLIPPHTTVPHQVHIDEAHLDLFNDFSRVRADGHFGQALEFLAQTSGTIDIVAGGPLTEIAAILRRPALRERLGVLTCQLGLFGFGGVTTGAGGKITFNSGAHPEATAAVLDGWPGAVYMVPTDITKQKVVGCPRPEDLSRFGVSGELAQLWKIFYHEALAPRGEWIFPHDVHPVLLMAQLFGRIGQPLYGWERVQINRIGTRGEIDATFNPEQFPRKRYVVKGVNAVVFRRWMAAALRRPS